MRGRIAIWLCLVAFFVTHTYAQQSPTTKYVLIKPIKKYDGNNRPYITTEVIQKTVDRLNEPLRALTAYYACGIQSNCEYFDTTGAVICQLNAALGLGKQGSDQHIALLQKWFPGNKEVQSIIDDHCWVGLPGSSNFLEYRHLSFSHHLDTVTIRYSYIIYSHGNITNISKREVACIKKDRILFLKK